jgi:transglutaminase-like putative cysteine protease
VTYRLEDNLTFVVQADGPFPQYEDITAIYSHDPVERGEQYTLVSEPSLAPATALREASTDYPAWVNRYLQLPGSLPPRVGELTRKIVAEAGATNPYDQAVALRDYLRANYKYNTRIAMPPPGVDKVDYFLFESKEGYCEYYSSALTVMLRVLNIPTREAVGYAPGEPDPASGEFVVRESSSHAWTEVYFPGYGWIEFEPTPSQAVITRPETSETPGALASPSIPYDPIDVAERDFRDPFDQPTPEAGGLAGGLAGFLDANGPGAVGGGLVLFGLVAFGFVWLLRQRARQRALAAGIITASGATYYERLLRLAWWAGMRPRPSETPFEFAEVVGEEVPTSRPYVRSIARA